MPVILATSATDERSLVIRANYKQVAKFGAAGAANTAVDFLIFNLLFGLAHLPLFAANLAAATVAMTLSMYLNRKFVFRAVDGRYTTQAGKFLLVTIVGLYVVQNLIIFIGLKVAHNLEAVALISGNAVLFANFIKALGVGIGAIWNFVLYKIWVFKDSAKSDEQQPSDTATS